MPYATQDDLVPERLTAKQLLELTTDEPENPDDPAPTEPDAEVVLAALTKASAMVDSFCGQRYSLPLKTSIVVTELTVDITVYRLYQRRGQVKKDSAVEIAYRDALAMLKQISVGTASLDQPDAPANPQTSSGGPVVTQIPQVFSDRNLEGY